MKPNVRAQSAKEDIIQKVAGAVTLQGPIKRMERWLDRKFKNYSFELKDGFIVSGKGRRPDQRVNIGHIRAWQEIWISGGVPFICIQLHDGTSVDWNDKYGSLFEILRVVAEDKEQPFAYV